MSIRRFLTTTALAALASCLAGAPAQAFTFQNIINPADPTFNQALGINNSGLITGYFGSGNIGFPNQGYTVPSTALTSFTSTNFPGSVQTQVTGLNNTGTLVGFWAPSNLGPGNDVNHGWYQLSGGAFVTVDNPLTTGTPAVNQLLGVNNSNVAVGFYNDAAGNSHGYTYNIGANTFTPVDFGLFSTTAAGINNAGDIVGFYTDAGGVTHGFLDQAGTFTTLDAPGSTFTQLLGVNNKGLIVGTDMDAAGNMHGVIFNDLTNTWTVSDAFGQTSNFTTFNGVNDMGQIVGFYTQDFGAGNTIGLLASSPAPEAGKGVLGLALLVLAIAMGRRLARVDSAPGDATL